MSENLATVSRDLLALPERPAGVFVMGDCAWNTGEAGDYSTFTSLMEPIRSAPLPVHLLLGNHDHRERFWAALEKEKAAKRPVKDRQVGLLKSARVNWFMLDSLETTNATRGLIGPQQLEWLGKTLDQNPRTPAIVLVHHNPDSSEKSIGLKDTEDFLGVIRPRRHVKACLFGHTHNWGVTEDSSGIHLINLPPTGYLFTEGKPNGWVRAQVEADGMKLELRCIIQTRKDHGQLVNLKWRKA